MKVYKKRRVAMAKKYGCNKDQEIREKALLVRDVGLIITYAYKRELGI
jgi:hypothetical protein